MRKLMLIIVMAITAVGHAQSWDEAYIESIYAGRQLAPIEGVWQYPGDGAKLAIVETSADKYDIYLIDSSRLDIKPGLIIGSVMSTAKQNTYDGELRSDRLGKGHKLSAQHVVMSVEPGGRLIIEPYKTGYSVSFARWISFFLKVRIIDNTDKRPHGLDGARRVYPYNINDHLPICL